MKLRVYACLCVCVFYSVCVKKEGEREHIGPIWYFFILPKISLKPLQGLNLKRIRPTTLFGAYVVSSSNILTSYSNLKLQTKINLTTLNITSGCAPSL